MQRLSEQIIQQAAALPEGTPLAAKGLLHLGSRAAVDQALSRLTERGLMGVIADAATDAKRKVRVVEWSHQPPDHPVLLTMPESEYLRGYILRVD